MAELRLIPIYDIPIIEEGDNIADTIHTGIESSGHRLENDDVIIIAHTIVSKSEGRVVKREDIKISSRAREIAEKNDFDPHQVELALQQAQTTLREDRALITVVGKDRICNFSGVDHSNAPPESYVLLPENSDESAQKIRENIKDSTGKEVAVIITDTEGRPWRKGAVNIALGCAGINAFKHNKGKRDLHGRELESSMVCQIDELAAAAGLVTGQANEGIPAVIVRGYSFQRGPEKGNDVNRPLDEALFK